MNEREQANTCDCKQRGVTTFCQQSVYRAFTISQSPQGVATFGLEISKWFSKLHRVIPVE